VRCIVSDIAIWSENLGKLYQIGALQRRDGLHSYKSFRETLANAALAPVHALKRRTRSEDENARTKIWALKDVSLEIKRGDIVGVIGRNGAGKSTLLKVLSRITDPTAGCAEIHGRVGSLLEVGTGFHPELSGRDNVYLNGAILGMRRAEISRQFDEIVAFAEVEKFIDTPVKHYSSGMYLRLAFSVAAHLQAEVLFVDEVLAVGDFRFQEKCLGKMHDVAATGRTIFFVSHSMTAIRRLCTRAIVMEGGRVIVDSSPQAAIAEYTSGTTGGTFVDVADKDRPTITRAEARLEGRTIWLLVEFHSPHPVTDPVLSFAVHNSLGAPIFGTDNRTDTITEPAEPASAGRFAIAIPADHLRPDRYMFSLWFGDYFTDHCAREMVLKLDLKDDVGGGLPTQDYGNVYLPTRWTFESLNRD
jgi:lipopolysaccharide transport system ATP-binding protein